MTGRPRSAADDALDAIDRALAEPDPFDSCPFPLDSPEAPVYDKADSCARCGAPASDERCAGCRAFLLGDTTTDPRLDALARPNATMAERRTQQHADALNAEQYWPAGMSPADVRAWCERCRCPACEQWLADHQAPPPTEHVGYREAMATAAAYPFDPPRDPEAGTEVLFVSANRVELRRWWGPNPAPSRYLLPVWSEAEGGVRAHHYDLAGAMWSADGRRRLVYRRTH